MILKFFSFIYLALCCNKVTYLRTYLLYYYALIALDLTRNSYVYRYVVLKLGLH